LKSDIKFKNIEKINLEEIYGVAYIPMKKPEYNGNHQKFERKIELEFIDRAGLSLEETNYFLREEYNLRREAYSKISKTSIPESVLDDRDMNGFYSLFVVYKKVNNSKNKALISARVFTNRHDIQKEICDKENKILVFDKDQQTLIENFFVLPNLEEGEIFVIDRMSTTFIREYKDELYGMLFKKIYDIYQNAKFTYALARRDKEEYLMCKYVRLGMKIEGECDYELHCKLRHWVLSGTVEDMRKYVLSSYKILKSAKLI